MFVHAVYFWLKPETTEAGKQQLIDDARHYLTRVPTVKHLLVGHPAMTPRPVVDNSYHVGLLVEFENKAGHDEYQVHPLHEEFVKRNGGNFGRVQIYDFVSV